MSTFNIYVASAHRYATTKVWKLLEYCTYVVRKSEEDLYRQHGVKDILAVDDEKICSFAKVHNWLINNAPEDVICVLDDDISNFRYTLDHSWRIKEKETVTQEIERLGQVLFDLDIGLLGSPITATTWNYREPFHFYGMIGPIRFYNRKAMKSQYIDMKFFSDTDLVLQELLKNRVILRPDYFTAVAPVERNAGGMNLTRNRKLQLELADYMSEKWGKYFCYIPDKNVSKVLVER